MTLWSNTQSMHWKHLKVDNSVQKYFIHPKEKWHQSFPLQTVASHRMILILLYVFCYLIQTQMCFEKLSNTKQRNNKNKVKPGNKTSVYNQLFLLIIGWFLRS